MTPTQVAAEALRQVRDGRDFPPLESVLKKVKADDAAIVPPGFKYSMITLAEHTWFWQNIWIRKVQGLRAPSMLQDWRVPETAEWHSIVANSFLDWPTQFESRRPGLLSIT